MSMEGIYPRYGCKIIRSFDELLDQEAFMGFEETGEKTYYVNYGQSLALVPHHEIIKKREICMSMFLFIKKMEL